MAIRIVRNEDGNCIEFRGSPNPVYWNACLSATASALNADNIHVINDIKTAGGDPVYEFYNVPFADFEDATGTAFADRQAAIDYININGNVAQTPTAAAYKGVWDADTNTPDLTGLSPQNGDWYWVTVAGTYDSVDYALNDQIRYSSSTSSWDKIEDVALRANDMIDEHDVYVTSYYTGTARTGSILQPYVDLQTAVDAANDGDHILINGEFVVTTAITLPAAKTLYITGVEGTVVKYNAYTTSNGNIFTYTGADYTTSLYFKNIIFQNAGGYAIDVSTALKAEITNCQFINCGWSGNRLDLVNGQTDTWANGGTLGYDSTQADLQSFFAAECSDGGGVKLQGIVTVELTDSVIRNSHRGAKIIDCGYVSTTNGFGYIARNQVYSNVGIGFDFESSTGNANAGCKNFTIYNNAVNQNGDSGIKLEGGLDNTVSLGVIKSNWNSGLEMSHVSNARIRDLDFDNNNRAVYDAEGEESDALATIQIEGGSLSADASFIAEILNVQIHNTGLGSNTVRCGILIADGVGDSSDNARIKIDNAGFLAQDYALDIAGDLSEFHLVLGDCDYIDTSIQNVRVQQENNYYSELPFSNHVTSVPSLNIVVDTLKNMISLREYVGGNVINNYQANELQAIEYTNHIDIIQRNSNKIQLRGLTLGNVYVNGVAAGNSVNSMANTVNAAFEMDLTEYKDFLVSEVGVNAGETLPAQTNNWYIAYGSRADEQVTTAGIVADYEDQQPFYNGNVLEKGHEYIWTHNNNASYMLGVWTGAQSAHNDSSSGGALDTINWTPGFRFVDSTNRFSGTASTGVDIQTRLNVGDNANVTADGQYDVVDGSTVLALRYGNDNYLYLLDITGGDEFIIGRSNTTLVGDSISIFFGGGNQPNAQFPVMQERTDRWTIIHDFDSSESSEWSDGIEADTVMRSNMEISPGEKVTMNFNYFGRAEVIGFGYSGAASGVNNAHDTIEKQLFYNSAEAIKGIEEDGDWTWNLNATYSYDPNGDQSDVGYDTGGNLGLISWRYKSDNTLEMWHETHNELMATLTAPLDGNPFKVYFGAAEAMPLERIPVLIKYDLTAVENNDNVSTWYYIESPDGVFTYPLFNTSYNAEVIDGVEGGSGQSQGYSFPDDPTGTIWYGPVTNIVTNGSVAPSHGVWGGSTNVLWNEIATEADSTVVPTAFTDATVSLNELASLNFQIHPADATFTTTIQSPPSWISQASDNANVTGTAPEVSGDSTNYPHTDYTVTVVRTNAYGSSNGTLTVRVLNTNALLSLSGTLHTGSVISSSGTNQAGSIYTGPTSTEGHFVYDIATLEDGDKIEWYHQEQFLGFGIVTSGVDKTTNILDKDSSPGTRWDLLAPITGVPTNTQGQNFGNVYGMVGLVPVGWDDNTNPQAIPTRPVYASTDVWKLYNNAGTIELSLNGVLFRSSSATYTDPVITFATPQFLTGATLPFPTFTHTANTATAPTGFTLEHGTMDTSSILNGDSVVTMDNFTLSPGQRLIATKAWADTNVLPYIDGASGEDNKVYIGVPKGTAAWGSVDLQDFFAVHRWENETANLTKITQYHAGTTPVTQHINRASDTDSHYNVGIEFTREGNIVIMRSPNTDPSLTTEPVDGTFGQITTWSGASSTTGTSALDVVVATKGTESRVLLSESGVSVITAPLSSNQFDVTEDSSSLPLFSGDPAGDITLTAGQTYKFWLHDSSIESTDSLEICLVSDNSTYTTGVTTSGTPGSFGAYLEFAIPSDVPPVKFKWTSGGVAYYATPAISGSTYSVSVTGITLEGPAANQSGTEIVSTTSGHGWVSIDEQLAAGERLVLDNAFFADLLAETPDNYDIAIGLKGDSWANTLHTGGSNQITTGMFKGDAYLNIRKSSTSSTYWQVFTAHGSSNSMFTNTSALVGTVCAFIEVTSSGNNIRIGFGRNGYLGVSQGDEATVAYADWGSYKAQTGDQGYGITSLDVMVGVNAVSSAVPFDGAEVDWTGLSEVSVPTPAATITTNWNKAVDFSGSNEHLKQVSSSSDYTPLNMGGLSITVAAPTTSGNTSNDTNARPWATAIVFNSDNNASNQHIWNMGEGAGSTDDNIYLRVSSTRDMFFAWGRSGATNECYLGRLSSTAGTWYGVYIAHTGERLSGGNASAANLADCFDIRIVNLQTGVAGTNRSTSQNWSSGSTGGRMDRAFVGDLTIGGRGANRNFHGKVAAMVVTTLSRDVAMPTDTEISMMVRDPQQWLTDYKVGNPYRRPSVQGNNSTFSLNSNVASSATQVWLMGDGTNDSYSNGIRSQVYSTEQNYVKMQFNSMSSNDIETVTISGLT